jgi:hypothetical protein
MSIQYLIELTELLKDVKKITNIQVILISFLFDVDATQITYIYHLIATYKPKGLTKVLTHSQKFF